jgi:type II secretory pathway component PulM
MTRVGLLVRVKGMTMTRNGRLLLSFGAAIVLAGFYFAVADPLLACEFGLC